MLLKKIIDLNNKFIKFLKYTASSGLIVLGLLILFDVVMRTFVNKPVIGVAEIIANSIVMIAFSQIAYTISIDGMVKSEYLLKKASYTDGEQAGGTGHEDHEWIKNFIQEQNPQKSGIQELEKVSTDELKKLLTQLVKKEDYESAAKVRDELSKRGEVEED